MKPVLQTRVGRYEIAVGLFTSFFLLAFFCAPAGSLGATSSPATVSGNSSRSLHLSAAPDSVRHPDAPRWPFLRLVGVLLTGVIISAARLARQFRQFWGLGVFTNFYAVLFLILSAGVCGIPMTAEDALGSIPHLESLSPWIADLSGILAALILPAIRFKSETAPTADKSVRDLPGASSNPVLAVIQDAICDRLLERMDTEIMAASRRYDWNTIKRAASRALDGEMTAKRLQDKEYNDERQAIDILQPNSDALVDSSNKYQALLRSMRWCKFRQLRRNLDAAAREAQT